MLLQQVAVKVGFLHEYATEHGVPIFNLTSMISCLKPLLSMFNSSHEEGL